MDHFNSYFLFIILNHSSRSKQITEKKKKIDRMVSPVSILNCSSSNMLRFSLTANLSLSCNISAHDF